MTILLHLLALYLAFGAVLQLITVEGIRPIGYVVGAVIWPWLLYVDGTPRIRPFLRWARGERVIEQSEWPVGVLRQTVQRRDGSEYYETEHVA